MHPWAVRFIRAPGGIAVLTLLLLLGSDSRSGGDPAGSPAPSALATLSPFPAIHSPNVADYATYQLKFTYLGSQKKSVASMAGVGTGRAFVGAAFVPYERDLDYGNDAFTLDTLVLPAADFKAFVDGIATQPALTDTVFRPNANASLMILRGSGPGELCWEHLADRAQTEALFLLLRDAVTNPADTATVSRYRRQMAGVRR